MSSSITDQDRALSRQALDLLARLEPKERMEALAIFLALARHGGARSAIAEMMLEVSPSREIAQ